MSQFHPSAGNGLRRRQDAYADRLHASGTPRDGTGTGHGRDYSGQGGQYTDPQTKRLVGVERDEVKHRFLRGEIDVLVCTDAAAEGLNLQTADLLVNYDLPWNPMKVEQRIGRIDRIGQRHEDIFVLNLCYADSAEQIVYDRLLNRLVDAGCRIADAMKVRKSELGTNAVLARLQREIERELNALKNRRQQR